jgi:hypothetical protein
MLTLSDQYALAVAETQKNQIISAGQLLLAQAEDFSPGSYAGFFFTEVSYILMAVVMLRSRLFGIGTAWVGLLGFALMFIYHLGYLVPVLYDIVLVHAGGCAWPGFSWSPAVCSNLDVRARLYNKKNKINLSNGVKAMNEKILVTYASRMAPLPVWRGNRQDTGRERCKWICCHKMKDLAPTGGGAGAIRAKRCPGDTVRQTHQPLNPQT